MSAVAISEDQIVAEVLNRWPEAVPVFLNRRMGCVGCCMAPFETLAEAANAYGFRPCHLLADLQNCIGRARTDRT